MGEGRADPLPGPASRRGLGRMRSGSEPERLRRHRHERYGCPRIIFLAFFPQTDSFSMTARPVRSLRPDGVSYGSTYCRYVLEIQDTTDFNYPEI